MREWYAAKQTRTQRGRSSGDGKVERPPAFGKLRHSIFSYASSSFSSLRSLPDDLLSRCAPNNTASTKCMCSPGRVRSFYHLIKTDPI